MSLDIPHPAGLYQVALRPNPADGFRGFKAEFSRINVVLGANGTGKSRLIDKLRSATMAFGGLRPVIFIEGGRVLSPPRSVGLTRDTIDRFRDVDSASQRQHTLQQNKLNDRVNDTFLLLARKGEADKVRHSDAVEAWRQGGRESEVPAREEPPLEKLFRLFSEIFPDITIGAEPGSGKIRCRKGESVYPPPDLSDGERQVLTLLADIALLAQPNSLVLVDEPELNLNTSLACRLWDSLEADLPRAVFVYATHSLGFAMRGNVERLFVLSGGGRRPIEVPTVPEIPQEELREFLGAIPAILAAPAAIIVEGQESSLDLPFYRWLLGRHELVIIPVGGSENVAAAVRRIGVWGRLAPSARIVGVLDRDYRSDATIAGFGAAGTIPLNFHEVESYLCWPQLYSDLSCRVGFAERPVSAGDIESVILSFVREKALGIAARRTFARASMNLGISLSRAALGACRDEKELRSALRTATQVERAKVEEMLGESVVDHILDEEIARIREVVQQQSISGALALAPGKELLRELLRQFERRSPAEFMRAASRHLDVSAYHPLRELRDAILEKLNEVETIEPNQAISELPIDDWPELDAREAIP